MIKEPLTGTARDVAGVHREEAANRFRGKGKQAGGLSRQVRSEDQADFTATKDAIEDGIWPDHPLWLGARP